MSKSKFRLPVVKSVPKYWSNINEVMDYFVHNIMITWPLKVSWSWSSNTFIRSKQVSEEVISTYWINQRWIYELLVVLLRCEVDSSKTREKSLYNFCICLFRKKEVAVELISGTFAKRLD